MAVNKDGESDARADRFGYCHGDRDCDSYGTSHRLRDGSAERHGIADAGAGERWDLS